MATSPRARTKPTEGTRFIRRCASTAHTAQRASPVAEVVARAWATRPRKSLRIDLTRSRRDVGVEFGGWRGGRSVLRPPCARGQGRAPGPRRGAASPRCSCRGRVRPPEASAPPSVRWPRSSGKPPSRAGRAACIGRTGAQYPRRLVLAGLHLLHLAEDEILRAQADSIPVFQACGTADEGAVDPNAVAAVEILHAAAARVDHDARVKARHERIFDGEVRLRASTKHSLTERQVDFLKQEPEAIAGQLIFSLYTALAGCGRWRRGLSSRPRTGLIRSPFLHVFSFTYL